MEWKSAYLEITDQQQAIVIPTLESFYKLCPTSRVVRVVMHDVDKEAGLIATQDS
jgi:hypothetical protein